MENLRLHDAEVNGIQTKGSKDMMEKQQVAAINDLARGKLSLQQDFAMMSGGIAAPADDACAAPR